MGTKFTVRLTEEERKTLEDVVRKRQSSREKIRRANILLKVDADGLNWNDNLAAAAFDCSRKTVENVRRRFVKNGLEEALNGVRRLLPPTPKKLDGRQEAEIIALRLGVPPRGYGAWSLRLLARKAVELKIADSVSHETVRKTLKKTALTLGKSSIG